MLAGRLRLSGKPASAYFSLRKTQEMANYKVNLGDVMHTFEGKRYGPGIVIVTEKRIADTLKASAARVAAAREAEEEERARQMGVEPREDEDEEVEEDFEDEDEDTDEDDE